MKAIYLLLTFFALVATTGCVVPAGPPHATVYYENNPGYWERGRYYHHHHGYYEHREYRDYPRYGYYRQYP